MKKQFKQERIETDKNAGANNAKSSYCISTMMTPFLTLADFNTAVEIISQLPAVIPDRDERIAHFLNTTFSERSYSLVSSDIPPFEQCVRAIEPELLENKGLFSPHVKNMLDTHAKLHPKMALPHFVLLPPPSQVVYSHCGSCARCKVCNTELGLLRTPLPENEDGSEDMARVFMQEYGTHGSWRAWQLSGQCSNAECDRASHKIHPNRYELFKYVATLSVNLITMR
jgi:hypothetical protein